MSSEVIRTRGVRKIIWP